VLLLPPLLMLLLTMRTLSVGTTWIHSGRARWLPRRLFSEFATQWTAAVNSVPIIDTSNMEDVVAPQLLHLYTLLELLKADWAAGPKTF